MKFFIISNPTSVKKEFEIINHLLKNYSVTFHLRKPEFDITQMSHFLDNIDRSLHSKITLHSHHQLIENYNLKGIHFTHHNKASISYFSNYNGSKSISTHSFEEIESYTHYFDYYFLSPIFQSISKPGYGGNSFDLNELSAFIQTNKDKNLVALGGITSSNIKITQSLGFYGVAMLGTFWQYCENSTLPFSINNFIECLNFHKIGR